MIQAGTNITAKDDPLKKIKLEYLYHSLVNPKPDVEFRIRQMRIIRGLDMKQYAAQKRMLPYVVSGIFNPPYRRSENFAFADYFIVDIDNLSDKGLSPIVVRQEIQTDSRVELCFLSPGEDGLKVVFRFRERCYDAGLYTLFYKVFVLAFSRQYHLEQVVDSRTCDVSRACFISIDADAYYNPQAEPVDLSAYLDTNNPEEIFQARKSLEKEEKQDTHQVENLPKDPDEETLKQIKQLLNPKLKKLPEKPPVYVPDVLEEVMDDLVRTINDTGLKVENIVSIQYGKKISASLGLKKAEVNLFYGKRGFSVIQSPKCGTNPELNQVLSDLVQVYVGNL